MESSEKKKKWCCDASLEQWQWPEDTVRLMESHLQLLLQHRGKGKGKEKEKEEEKGNKEGVEGKPVPECLGSLIDLSSRLPLPPGWEQFLDLQSGEIYYMDSNMCKRRTDIDPREFIMAATEAASSTSQSQITSVGDFACISGFGTNVVESEKDEEAESRYTTTTSSSSINTHLWRYEMASSSSSSPNLEMVARGCWQCLNYVMHPKDIPFCPNCRASLV